MKRVTVSSTEYKTFQFPEDAPTDNEQALAEYVENHPEAQGDWDYFCVETISGDWEFDLSGKED